MATHDAIYEDILQRLLQTDTYVLIEIAKSDLNAELFRQLKLRGVA